MISFEGDAVDPFDESHKATSYVAPQINKQIRSKVLQQDWLTNRFRGSAQAKMAEKEFAIYISRYQLKRVRYRLAATGLLLVFSAFEQLGTQDGTMSFGAYLVLHTLLPMLILLTAALLCWIHATRTYWRWHVVGSGVLAYTSVLWSDALVDVSKWSISRQEYSVMLHVVWLLIAAQFFSLGFSLDFVYVCAVAIGQWLSFLSGVLYLHFRWLGLYESSNAELRNMTRACVEAFNTTITDDYDLGSGRWKYWALLEGILVGTGAVALLLIACQRLNRFERQSFVNSYVLLNKTVNEEKRKRGEGRELLALFSNPSAPQQLQLKPLQLGQELKFLLRSIPNSYLTARRDLRRWAAERGLLPKRGLLPRWGSRLHSGAGARTALMAGAGAGAWTAGAGAGAQ